MSTKKWKKCINIAKKDKMMKEIQKKGKEVQK